MTTASDQDAPSAKSGRSMGSAIFLIAMGVALATTSGAILTTVGIGDLQDIVRNLGWPGTTDTFAEQLRQTAAIARLENDVRTLTDEISDLKARHGETRIDPRIERHLARLDDGVAQLQSVTTQLRIESGELRSAQSDVAAREASSDRWYDLKTSLAQAGIDIDAMRSSLDASDHSRRKEIVDIGQRVDRLEHMIAVGDVTGSLGSMVRKRRGLVGPRKLAAARAMSGWSVLGGQNGAATITGQNGTYDVTSGSFVPGIGRVSSVRQRANRWVVVTEKGTIVQR